MGVKPAANFFQKTMACEVLSELLFQVCEVYIDDILVFGRIEDEYIENLLIKNKQVILTWSMLPYVMTPKLVFI